MYSALIAILSAVDLAIPGSDLAGAPEGVREGVLPTPCAEAGAQCDTYYFDIDCWDGTIYWQNVCSSQSPWCS